MISKVALAEFQMSSINTIPSKPKLWNLRFVEGISFEKIQIGLLGNFAITIFSASE
jgi:hypothetical protein